ncbi:hypothetical protein BV20DRAFT_968139 [Pilatotrama ljubarskyi]|nr:hypothetical protein BV20DRAFT_968139 [Pilatotrama ljubarskyi]
MAQTEKEGPVSDGRTNRPGLPPNGGDRRSQANMVPAPQRLQGRRTIRQPLGGSRQGPSANTQHAALRELSDSENLYQILGSRKRPPPVAEAKLEEQRDLRRRPQASAKENVEEATYPRGESRCDRARR